LELSGTALNLARGLFSGESYDPRQIALHAARATAAFADVVAGTLPRANQARWLELSNKLTAYRIFAASDGVLAQGALGAVLGSVGGLDPYRRLWLTEGIGWYWADRHRGDDGPFFDGASRHALIPLHTGTGLALAQAALHGVQKENIEAALAAFWDRCDLVSVPGYRDAAVEALGLVTINLYPDLIPEIDRAWRRREDYALFWHGAGRGAYFSPLTFVPLSGSRRRVFGSLFRMPSTDEGRENVLAGFAWATTLVNVQHPEVLDCCREDLGSELASSAALRNGAAAALAVWRESSSDEIILRRWSGLPEARDAIRIGDAAARSGAWGDVFRARSVSEMES
jgi:hypothetical protein